MGNSLYIDGKTPGLVLTGPNAGGKTIILKTLGTASAHHRFGTFRVLAHSQADLRGRVVYLFSVLTTASLICPSGLLGLLVRLGIPVPCQRGARVDFFSPILADIGDMQSVTGDLSTFSGHLLVRPFHSSGVWPREAFLRTVD